MTSKKNLRSYALIDGASRQTYHGSQGNANLAYWDDPSYHNPASKLRDNSDAYRDSVLKEELLDPQGSKKPYLSHEEITRIVSKQFAADIKERSYASEPLGKASFALVFVVSILPAMGLMDIIVYASPLSNQTQECFDPKDRGGLQTAAWLWVTAGVWCSLAPIVLGMLMTCSDFSSSADHTHTFDPVLRRQGQTGKGKKENRKYNILTIVSFVTLVLGFICGAIDAYVFSGCLSTFIIKVIPSIVVCIDCIVVVVVLVVLWLRRRKQAEQNSNYDRRDYDITLDHGWYAPGGADETGGVKRSILVESVPLPAVPQRQEPSQPLVTIIDQTPAYPMIQPPPPPPPPRPYGPPLFAGPARLPVRGARYQRPMFYQMPNYGY